MWHLAKLPEKGKEVVRSLAQHFNPRHWDLSEKAMHALQGIASVPGSRHTFEVCIYRALLPNIRLRVGSVRASQDARVLSPTACLLNKCKTREYRIVELMHATQGADVDRKLASFAAEVKGENADDKDSYLTDLESLAGSTRCRS